jgi:hypothetical protein
VLSRGLAIQKQSILNLKIVQQSPVGRESTGDNLMLSCSLGRKLSCSSAGEYSTLSHYNFNLMSLREF